jgi:hypothetical protein
VQRTALPYIVHICPYRCQVNPNLTVYTSEFQVAFIITATCVQVYMSRAYGTQFWLTLLTIHTAHPNELFINSTRPEFTMVTTVPKRSMQFALGPSKRRRVTKSTMRVPLSALPRSVIPETKFHDTTIVTVASNFMTASIVPPQGQDGDQFIGSQLRCKSLDFSWWTNTATPDASVRISVLIPKDPSITPVFLPAQSRYDHHDFTVVHDVFFSTQDTRCQRISLPINAIVRFNKLGTTITQNDIFIAVNSTANLAQTSECRLYYTDA